MSNRRPSHLDQELAAFLKREMQAHGWSYAEMGQRSGVDGSTIHRIISGEHLATLWLVAQIMKGLKKDIEDVFPTAVQKGRDRRSSSKPGVPTKEKARLGKRSKEMDIS